MVACGYLNKRNISKLTLSGGKKMKRFIRLLKKMFSFNFFGCLAIALVVAWIISIQISNRTSFANTELYQEVIDRWGAPISQPAPSVMYINTGSVFTDLKKLPLSSQQVTIDATMNYRKRGLVYFSGFDFKFSGNFVIENKEENDIDVVFVFPINLERNKVLLSELAFYVNDQLTNIGLSEATNQLVWTGRLQNGQPLTFKIEYNGRGLDQFIYVLDPSMPVKNFSMVSNISGGSNFDYAQGVIPATEIKQVNKKNVSLFWRYKSLESGVPVGLILPSEKSFSKIISTMTGRSWATFILFFIGVIILSLYTQKQIKFYELYLISGCYAFFFVLLAYLAAFINFYAAYVLSLFIISAFLYLYINRILSPSIRYTSLCLLFSFLFVPTMAVILQGYTGLIYTLEILTGIGTLMWLSTRQNLKSLLDTISTIPQKGEQDENSN